LSYKYTINPQYTNFKETLLNIQNIFRSSNDSIHKARNELKRVELNSIQTIIKSFKVPNILNQIVYAYFRDSKAKKSYEYSLKIGEFTPEPIGYIEFYSLGLLKDSYFISECFEYDFTIREPLLEEHFENREAVFRAFARFSLELHNAGIFHNDYSPGNILIKKSQDGFIFKIVDINRMKFSPLNEELRAKNFSKLWASKEILSLIADEYTKHFECSKSFKERVIFYSQKNKKIKNFKKRLKGKKVTD